MTTKKEKDTVNKNFDINNLGTREKALGSVVSSDKFSKMLGNIVNSSNTLAQITHEAAITALIQAFAHDNFDYLTRLYKAVLSSKNGVNTAKQIVIWAQTYSPARLTVTKQGKVFRKNKKEKAFDFIEAMANPYYTVELMTEDEAKRFTVEDLEKAIDSLVKRAEKALQGEAKKHFVEDEDKPAIHARLEAVKQARNITVFPAISNTLEDEKAFKEDLEKALSEVA